MPVLVRNAIQHVTVQAPTAPNLALTGTMTASDTYSPGYPPEAANNGDRKGLNWGAGGGWNSVGLPAWLQVAWSRGRTINRIDVFHIQDAYAAPVEPTLSTQFTLYGNVNFNVEYWNVDLAAWVAVGGGIVTGNNKVWRQFLFPALFTTKIRVNVTGNTGVDSYARIAEIEVYGPVGWDPATLGTIVARYKAKDMVGFADNDPVTTWIDTIGDFDATASAFQAPVYRSGAGNPYVSFDGSPGKVLLTPLTTNFGDFAVFAVFRWPNVGAFHGRIVDKQYINGFWIGHQPNTPNAGGGILDGGPYYGHFLLGTNNTWYAFLFQRGGTTKTIKMNGETLTQTVVDTLCDSTPLRIGNEDTVGSPEAVDFKEIVVFDADIEGKNLSALQAYALAEYGLIL